MKEINLLNERKYNELCEYFNKQLVKNGYIENFNEFVKYLFEYLGVSENNIILFDNLIYETNGDDVLLIKDSDYYKILDNELSKNIFQISYFSEMIPYLGDCFKDEETYNYYASNYQFIILEEDNLCNYDIKFKLSFMILKQLISNKNIKTINSKHLCIE